MAHKSKYLDPKILAKAEKLYMKARFVVEGFMAGAHKSPYHGFSVEFAQHREYSPGDDLRHLDWRVFARSDRYYIKQYEEETNFIANILLDASESMLYGSGETTKLEYAGFLTAALVYLINTQQDSVGVGIFDESLRRYLEPSGASHHILNVVDELDQTEPKRKTNTGGILHEFAERIRRRGIVIVISDLFDNVEGIMAGIQHMRFLGHEVVLFHVLDKDELDFPFDGLVKFEGLEEYPEVTVRPRQLREAYLRLLGEFVDRLRTGCERNHVDYVKCNTSEPLDVQLASYMGKRLMKRVRV